MAAAISSLKMALRGVSLTTSILVFMMTFAVQPSLTETAACTRYVSSCGQYSSYFNAYDLQVGQEYKTLDGIQAQISYINLANNDQLEKLFHPGRIINGSDRKDLTKVIKSLIELNLMRERIQEMGDLGIHSTVIGTLFSHAADDACQYLKSQVVGIPIGNCTDRHLLEQLNNRLKFVEALYAARVLVKNSIEGDSNSRQADFCAWMNDRALNNCQESSTRGTPEYSSLNAVCTTPSLFISSGYPLCPQ